MLRTEVVLSDIDYISIIDLLMPQMEIWLKNKNNALLELLKHAISKNGKTNGFSKFIVNAIPGKYLLLVTVLHKNKAIFLDYMNETFRKKGIIVVASEFDFESFERGKEAMLKMEITLEDLDYEETIMNLTPQLLQKLAEQESNSSKLAQFLLSTKDLPVNMLKAAIGVIPKEQRDDLLANILMLYDHEITDSINAMIFTNNIKAKVKDLNIRSNNHQIKYK